MGALDLWRRERPLATTGSWGSLARDFDRVFDEMEQALGGSRAIAGWGGEGHFFPACDVEETESGYKVAVDLPGIEKGDLSVEVSGNNQLRIAGERKSQHEEREGNMYRCERQHGRFQRTIALPESIDASKIVANFDQGVLLLEVPKSELSRATKIQIHEGKPGFIDKIANKTKKIV